MKRLICTAIFLSLLLSVLVACGSEVTNAAIAEVNGEAITQNELDYFKERLRLEIINEYTAELGITDFAGFWTQSFSGSTPEHELTERAVEECVTAKIKLMLCRDNGVYSDISFEALKARAEKFNSSQGSGTVGIKTISPEQFYIYYIDTGVMELKNILKEGSLAPTDSEIQVAIDSLPAKSKSQFSEKKLQKAAIDKVVDKKFDLLVAEQREKAEIIVY